MLAAIDGAQRQILFETYIWKGDEVGEKFKAALAAAADRGVEVYCIYDGFANLVVSPRFKRFPPTMKVLRYPIYPAGWKFYDFARYGRDHRKILVVDDAVGFVGGYNIGTAYATEWRDTHVRITGPGVWDLKRAFADFWNLNRRRRIGTSERPLLLETASTWETRIRFHRNVPRLWMFPIRSMYIEAINRASQRVWMTHAYFCPDQDFVDAMKAAAQRGVDVRLLLPLKSNHIVADWISRGYFSQLLDAGVRIFRFRDAMVHAKTSTIDSTWSTDRHRERRPAQPPGQLRDQRRGDRPGLRGHHGGDLRRRRVELPRAHRRRVGGPRPAPQVHRDDPGAAATAALTPTHGQVDLRGHPVLAARRSSRTRQPAPSGLPHGRSSATARAGVGAGQVEHLPSR